MPMKPSLALRAYTIFVAAGTFLLVVAGGAAASFGLGDTPLVHGHQDLAATVGLLTLILAWWLRLAPVESALKRAGGPAVALVLLQGILGGVSIFFEWPTTTAVAHACLGQLFFAWMACTAWIAQTSSFPTAPALTPEARKMARLAATTTGFVLLQLLAGAIYRHTGKGLHFHFLGAFLVVVHGILVLRRAFASPTLTPVVRTWAVILNGFISAQLILGFCSWQMPAPVVVTAHQSVGALILAAALIITVQSTRTSAA